MGAVHQVAELTGVNKEHVPTLVAEFTVFLIAGQEPQAGRDLRPIEKLAGQGDHAVHQVGLDDGLADLSPSPD